MKKFFSFLLFAFILFACNQKNTENELLRRFTFAIPSTMSLPEGINKEDSSMSMELFERDGKAFLIVDAPDNQNYDGLMNVLQSENPSMHTALKASLPLERIYKLDQQKEYTAAQGQLIKPQENTKRYVLTLEIVNDPDLKEEYKRVHAKGMAWPEISNNMKQVGIRDMEIYLDGYQAYLIMDTREDFDFAKDGEQWSKLPREAEWQEYVAKFQKVDPQSKATEKWQEMKYK